jgi:hypothetical protein
MEIWMALESADHLFLALEAIEQEQETVVAILWAK